MNDKQQHAILVVDDLEDWRSTLGGLLKDEGYRVGVAGSSKEALQALAEQPFDLAVIDVRLDDSDETNIEGLSLASRIKAGWRHVKVILITGYETEEVLRQAFARDDEDKPLVNEFILKTETKQLVEKVQAVLAA